MIIELKIKNFLSFKDEVTFSFEATKDKSLEENQVVEVAPNIRILRLAIVYGANASGKTNLLNAFEFLRDFWFEIPDNKDDKTGVIPFLLDKTKPNEPSEFSLTFFTNGFKHLYTLVIKESKIISEKLYMYPGTQPALIFSRELKNGISEIKFNLNKIKINLAAKNEISVKCLTNMSVLAAYNQVNIAVPEIDNVIKWIKIQYMQPIEPTARLVDFVEEKIKNDKSLKNYILNHIKRADYNITDINTKITNKKVPENILINLLNNFKNIPIDERKRIEKEHSIKLTKTEFKHKIINSNGNIEYYNLPKSLQSEGTLRTFGILGLLKIILDKDAFLTIDEIESSLHPILIESFIEDFFQQKGESQLLLTTHYDGLLEETDLFRKDSIWFTNKKEDGATEIYSLADFNGLNRISSLQKAYKYGKFGAIPNISEL